MLQNQTWVKDTCEIQDRPMNSNVTTENFIDTVSDFICKTNFKKFPCVKFHIDLKKSIHNYLPFPTT